MAGLIRYHEKHNILIIPGDLPYLHMQDNEPEWTCAVAGQETHAVTVRQT